MSVLFTIILKKKNCVYGVYPGTWKFKRNGSNERIFSQISQVKEINTKITKYPENDNENSAHQN